MKHKRNKYLVSLPKKAICNVVWQSEKFQCLMDAAKGDKCKSECDLCEGIRKKLTLKPKETANEIYYTQRNKL